MKMWLVGQRWLRQAFVFGGVALAVGGCGFVYDYQEDAAMDELKRHAAAGRCAEAEALVEDTISFMSDRGTEGWYLGRDVALFPVRDCYRRTGQAAQYARVERVLEGSPVKPDLDDFELSDCMDDIGTNAFDQTVYRNECRIDLFYVHCLHKEEECVVQRVGHKRKWLRDEAGLVMVRGPFKERANAEQAKTEYELLEYGH